MLFFVVYEVITRRVFGKPTVWTFEIITMTFGFHFMFAAAYTLLHRKMACVDLLYSRLSPKKQAVLDIFTYGLFFFPFVIGVLIYSVSYAFYSWETLERSWSVFAPPIYPFKTVIPIVFALLLLQGISEVLKRILILKGEEF